MVTITDNDLALFRERAKTELKSTGDIGRLAWDDVVDALCKEVARLRSVSKERGDAAKLREALKRAWLFVSATRESFAFIHEGRIERDKLCDDIDAALAASPRNCESLDCPTDCNDKVIHLSDRVHMLNTDSLGDHEWDDEVCSLEFVGRGGGDTWLIHGREGAAWACECEVLAPATEKEGGNDGK